MNPETTEDFEFEAEGVTCPQCGGSDVTGVGAAAGAYREVAYLCDRGCPEEFGRHVVPPQEVEGD